MMLRIPSDRQIDRAAADVKLNWMYECVNGVSGQKMFDIVDINDFTWEGELHRHHDSDGSALQSGLCPQAA